MEQFDCLSERSSSDHPAVNCPSDHLIEVCRVLRDSYNFDLLIDVTAIDRDVATPRFTGIYHLYSTSLQSYIRSLRIVQIIKAKLTQFSLALRCGRLAWGERPI